MSPGTQAFLSGLTPLPDRVIEERAVATRCARHGPIEGTSCAGNTPGTGADRRAVPAEAHEPQGQPTE